MNDHTHPRRIHVLRDSVAKRIAAGEVIDRPFSVVRELLDNSIDAGADEIALYIQGGGIKTIRCVDNGRGMDREDLELCWLPHSTSKISAIEDLDSLDSLGFRGEALSSIGACARVRISSKPADSPLAHCLFINNGKKESLTETNTADGTTVEVNDLFYSIPARLKFLKRESTETAACRSMFLEKASAFPGIAFRLFTDNKLSVFLPKSSLRERIIAAGGNGWPAGLTYQAEKAFGSFSVTLIMAGPSVYRKDRRQIQIFVNGRRIQEFALVQAAEYSYTGYLPGGCFPVICVFITIRPNLIDFNIHPAKREIKFVNLQEIHRAVVSIVQQELNGRAREVQSLVSDNKKTPSSGELFSKPAIPDRGSTVYAERSSVSITADHRQKEAFSSYVAEHKNSPQSVEPVPGPGGFVYFGQIFTTFLLCLKDDRFYFIDQHAAHEKILYEQLLGRDKEMQDLLVPVLFQVEHGTDQALGENLDALQKAGITMERIGNGEWQITALTPLLSGQQEHIIEFLQQENFAGEKFSQEFFARLACRSAIKDGDGIDDLQAGELIRQAFSLANPRCPHGRPLWFSLTKEELFRFVGRII
ncbi:MAG: DNA mismatch repair endonuclease MutL [Spirochaetales bacterium]|nr:DNA mismatch repair endonuclease MutL [Spirochaetales bacterium]